ncbi:maleylpyruvate isomerase family mycothiol-dependent enzyme [Kitasatospora sp. NPDC056181]|uniref:maleylpyruvate isomerase family mycothiol-dependent enzyme n=1 Tax=Kitasatospora sp. NPDC056181 TaxID=3345737 RepID=UPI0035DC6561
MTPPLYVSRSALIDELTHSGARLAGTLAALTGEDLRAASALPGWTRAHVVAHLARSADAYRRLLKTARTGAEPGPRPDAGALTRAVEDSAARPAPDLVDDLHDSLAALIEDARSMPATAWDAEVTAAAGWPHPAWFTLYRCWRELETHHTDLAAGHGPSDWPAPYVAWALDDTLTTLAARDFPLGRVDAVDLGRQWTLAPSGPAVTAPGHAVLAWLTGRTDTSPLTFTDGPLPVPPAWPLPPTRPWTWT